LEKKSFLPVSPMPLGGTTDESKRILILAKVQNHKVLWG